MKRVASATNPQREQKLPYAQPIFALNLRDLGGNRGVSGKLGPEAPLELLAQFGNFHSGHNDKLAAQHFPGFIVIRQLAGNAAVLTILIPAKTPVRNRFRTDELKTSQKRVTLRHLELLPHDGDVHQLFIMSPVLRGRAAV
jgi:hypothetical protein